MLRGVPVAHGGKVVEAACFFAEAVELFSIAAADPAGVEIVFADAICP